MMKLPITPLVRLEKVSKGLGSDVYAKLENVNPTGSHKDRESLAMLEDMSAHHAKDAVIASTGNAAISLSALALGRGIHVIVFVSRNISRERFDLISVFKPDIRMVDGGYDDAVRESERFVAANGLYDANPGHNSHKIVGDSGIGTEISSQLGNSPPDYIVVPTNNGTLISGVWAGVRKSFTPKMIGAVARESALMGSISGYHRFEEQELDRTLSEGGSEVVNITDEEAAEATRELWLEGVFCEPASAASLAALKKLNIRGKSVVLVITGSAFKFLDSYSKAIGTALASM